MLGVYAQGFLGGKTCGECSGYGVIGGNPKPACPIIITFFSGLVMSESVEEFTAKVEKLDICQIDGGKHGRHSSNSRNGMKNICYKFMQRRCKNTNCVYIHDGKLCPQYYRTGHCSRADECTKNHFVSALEKEEAPEDTKEKRTHRKPGKRTIKRNTETWEPMKKPVDVRIVFDLGHMEQKCTTQLTDRDILLAPNLFHEYPTQYIYNQLVQEIENCGLPKGNLLKLWHGNDKIEGTHFIADDKMAWKKACPTFELVLDRVKTFFQMEIRATRFNWYKDTSQWKPFHFDAAAMKPEKAALQNFTVGVSFGATRDAAFEHASTKTVLSLPQADGCIYAFAKDTNILWRHGILQDNPVRNEGRISIIAWGWVDQMVPVA